MGTVPHRTLGAHSFAFVANKWADKAAELVDYAKCLMDQSDPDIQNVYPFTAPTSQQSWLELEFANDSRIVGIPHGASKIRVLPSLVPLHRRSSVCARRRGVLRRSNFGLPEDHRGEFSKYWLVRERLRECRMKELPRGLTEKRTPQGISVLTPHYTDLLQPE